MIFDGLTPEKVRADFLSAERYQEFCDQVWSTDRRSGRFCGRAAPRAGDAVYAKADHTIPLFGRLKKSRSRVVLVTAESDITIDDQLAASAPPQVGSWFSTNAQSSQVRPLPLGLGNSYCMVTNKAPALADALAASSSDRAKLLYVNFRPSSNPAVREPMLAAWVARRREPWVTVRTEPVAPDEFLREMTEHKFVLCPAGNGIDSHRIWEALYTGTIPVVQNNAVFRDFRSLPICFVDDLASVDEAMLRNAWREMAGKKWNTELLFCHAWHQRIAERKRAISGSNARVSLGRFVFARLPARQNAAG